MATTTTTVTTCDKCNAVIAPTAARFEQMVRQKAKTLPFPDRSVACSAACCAAIMTANAAALTAP